VHDRHEDNIAKKPPLKMTTLEIREFVAMLLRGDISNLIERITAGIATDPSPNAWQRHLLDFGILISLVFGTVVYIPSVIAAVWFESWLVAIADTIAIVTVFLLYKEKQLRHEHRAQIFCGVLYLLEAVLKQRNEESWVSMEV
jgi:hypothetical protein